MTRKNTRDQLASSAASKDFSAVNTYSEQWLVPADKVSPVNVGMGTQQGSFAFLDEVVQTLSSVLHPEAFHSDAPLIPILKATLLLAFLACVCYALVNMLLQQRHHYLRLGKALLLNLAFFSRKVRDFASEKWSAFRGNRGSLSVLYGTLLTPFLVLPGVNLLVAPVVAALSLAFCYRN
ncbi:MAG: hypothetical protein ACE5IY_17475, partial [bacterium]